MLKELFQEDPSLLFKQARKVARLKKTIFSTPAHLSSHCLIEPVCRYCRWRSMSRLSKNYGRDVSLEESIEKARAASKAGIHRIHMASGWLGYDLPDFVYEHVRAMRANTTSELWGFSGSINRSSMEQLKQAGADGYWCGLESANEKLFQQIRPGDDFKSRIKTLEYAKELGLKTWSAFIFGVGETETDIIGALTLMKELLVDSIVIMPLKPMPYTEMEKSDPPNMYKWAQTVAIATIFMENADIFTNPDQAAWGIRAGANAFFPVNRASEMEEILQMRRQANNVPDELVKRF